MRGVERDGAVGREGETEQPIREAEHEGEKLGREGPSDPGGAGRRKEEPPVKAVPGGA